MLKLYTSPTQLFLFVCCYVNFVKGDHCWRDYTGVIPHDAFVAGRDINDKNIYVGQAYVKDRGIIVGQINKGVRELSLPIDGVTKSSFGAKILCTKYHNELTWMSVNGTNIGTILLNKKVVIGGLEHDHGGETHLLYIGRVFSQGEIKIGKVITFTPTDWGLYVPENGKETIVKNYEILIINENPPDVGSR